MSTDIERLDENAKDMKFLIYCLIVVMLIPLGFLVIIAVSDTLSPGESDEAHTQSEAVEEDEATEAETEADAETGWIVLDIDTFA